MPRFRIILADDHGLIVEGLRSLLAAEFDVVAVAADGRELVRQVELLQPDAILLDIAMPLLNGIEAARQIKKVAPKIKIVFVTQNPDREYVQVALRLGASGYVLKQSAVRDVVNALHEVLAGGFYVSPLLRRGISEVMLKPGQNPSELFGIALTPRQRQVLQLVAEGKSTKETAAILNISVKTVDFHKAGIMEEVGVRTTAELTRYAIQHGIISGP
jgi:DNA-binding NarL/FixJ family response regulator